MTHLLAAIGGGGGGDQGNPWSFALLSLQKASNTPPPLPWGQRSVLCQVKGCNISKEFYWRNHSFLPKNIVVYHLSMSPFCQNMFTNIPSPFAEGNGTHFQLHLQNGGGTTNPEGVPLGSCYKSAKAFQSPHPRLKINDHSWQIPCHARECPRGYPPGWPLINQG